MKKEMVSQEHPLRQCSALAWVAWGPGSREGRLLVVPPTRLVSGHQRAEAGHPSRTALFGTVWATSVLLLGGKEVGEERILNRVRGWTVKVSGRAGSLVSQVKVTWECVTRLPHSRAAHRCSLLWAARGPEAAQRARPAGRLAGLLLGCASGLATPCVPRQARSLLGCVGAEFLPKLFKLLFLLIVLGSDLLDLRANRFKMLVSAF